MTRTTRTSLRGVLAMALAAAAVLVAPAPPAVAEESFAPPASGSWAVSGRGYGHGIGLSQWGAQGAALQGLTREQILAFYYPGTIEGYVANPLIRVQLTAYQGSTIVFSPLAGESFWITDRSTGDASPLPGGTLYRLTAAADALTLSQWNGVGWDVRPVGARTALTGPVETVGGSGVWLHSSALTGSGRQYRGSLQMIRTAPTSAQAVNVVDLDGYLKGVVPRETPQFFAAAALAAQAVAARSYALAVSTPSAAWDICDTTACQVYGGKVAVSPGNALEVLEYASTNAAVDSTSGIVRAYNNAVAFTQFSSSSGGYSRAGSKPYLVAQPDPYSASAPGDSVSRWTNTLPVSRVQAYCPSGGSLLALAVTGRDGKGDFGGRITSLRVDCTTGSRSLTAAADLKLGMLSSWWSLGPAVSPSTPVGNVESITADGAGIRVSGWALDPDTSAPLNVRIDVDGALTTVAADGNRPDVGATYPRFGPNHGFDTTVQAPAGARRVCVTAVNLWAGSDLLLGCATVTVPTGIPFGGIDEAVGVPASPGAPGGVRVRGWAIDPDTASPIDVHVTGGDGGIPAIVRADQPRADLALAFPPYGGNHGFTVVAPAGPGPRTVCQYAINVPAPAGNPLLSCRTATVPGGSPFGNAESVAAFPGGVSVAGWALDPDTTAAVPIQVWVDGALQAYLPADQPRPDVAAVFPLYGTSRGFAASVPLAAGKRTVCLAMSNAGAGAGGSLGCRTVTVPGGSPFGNYEAATTSAGVVTVTGWSIDPDTSAPVAMQVWVDGVLRAFAPADVVRADVGLVFPAYGPAHGFSIAAAAAPGARTVCVAATNAGVGSSVSLGCRLVNVG